MHSGREDLPSPGHHTPGCNTGLPIHYHLLDPTSRSLYSLSSQPSALNAQDQVDERWVVVGVSVTCPPSRLRPVYRLADIAKDCTHDHETAMLWRVNDLQSETPRMLANGVLAEPPRNPVMAN